jgi:hypothetical protein
MSGDAHVRFRESAGVQLPRATPLPVYRQRDLSASCGSTLMKGWPWAGRTGCSSAASLRATAPRT